VSFYFVEKFLGGSGWFSCSSNQFFGAKVREEVFAQFDTNAAKLHETDFFGCQNECFVNNLLDENIFTKEGRRVEKTV
jgi:hypothetical protein